MAELRNHIAVQQGVTTLERLFPPLVREEQTVKEVEPFTVLGLLPQVALFTAIILILFAAANIACRFGVNECGAGISTSIWYGVTNGTFLGLALFFYGRSGGSRSISRRIEHEPVMRDHNHIQAKRSESKSAVVAGVSSGALWPLSLSLSSTSSSPSQRPTQPSGMAPKPGKPPNSPCPRHPASCSLRLTSRSSSIHPCLSGFTSSTSGSDHPASSPTSERSNRGPPGPGILPRCN